MMNRSDGIVCIVDICRKRGAFDTDIMIYFFTDYWFKNKQDKQTTLVNIFPHLIPHTMDRGFFWMIPHTWTFPDTSRMSSFVSRTHFPTFPLNPSPVPISLQPGFRFKGMSLYDVSASKYFHSVEANSITQIGGLFSKLVFPGICIDSWHPWTAPLYCIFPCHVPD